MHSYRLRYVVLGLLIYLQNAFCRTCGSDFDDIASKVVISDVVFEGRLSDNRNGQIEYKPGKVFLGEHHLPRSRRDPDKYMAVDVGIFQGNCTAPVDKKKKYIVFLNSTLTSRKFYWWTVLPIEASRKVKREIEKTVECLPKCGKEPKVRISPKGGSVSYKEGNTLTLKCKVSVKSPESTIEWFKDGQLLEQTKKYKYRNSKGKSSRLRIKKVSGLDSGTYSCKATNVIGSTEQTIVVTVNTEEDSTTTSTTTSTTQSTTSPTAIPTSTTENDHTLVHFELCEKQNFCLNGGTCYKQSAKNSFCRCQEGFIGMRCELKDIYSHIIDSLQKNDRQQFDRQMTILGLVVGVLVLVAVCIAGYCMAREKRKAYRKKIAERRRLQNLYTNGTPRSKPGPEEKEPLQPITAKTTGIELRHMFPSAYDASTQTDALWSDHLPSNHHHPQLAHHPLQPPPDDPICPPHFPTENNHLSAPELQSLLLPTTSSLMPELDMGGSSSQNHHHQPLINAAMVNAVVELEPDQHSSHSSPNQSQNSRTESAHDGIPSLKDEKDPEAGFGELCHTKQGVPDELGDMVDLLEQSKSSLEAALIEFDAQSDYDNQQASDLEVNVESEADAQALEDPQANNIGQMAEERLYVDSEGEESESDTSASEEQALFQKLKSRHSSVASSDQNDENSFLFGPRDQNGLGENNSWQNAVNDNRINDSSPQHQQQNYAFNPYASDEEQTGSNYFGNFGTPSCSRRGSQQQAELMLRNALLFDPDPDATPI